MRFNAVFYDTFLFVFMCFENCLSYPYRCRFYGIYSEVKTQWDCTQFYEHVHNFHSIADYVEVCGYV